MTATLVVIVLLIATVGLLLGLPRMIQRVQTRFREIAYIRLTEGHVELDVFASENAGVFRSERINITDGSVFDRDMMPKDPIMAGRELNRLLRSHLSPGLHRPVIVLHAPGLNALQRPSRGLRRLQALGRVLRGKVLICENGARMSEPAIRELCRYADGSGRI